MNVSGFQIGTGHYNTLLGFNVVSTVVCWGLGAIALLDNRAGHRLDDGADDESEAFDAMSSKDVTGGGGSPQHQPSNTLMGLPVPRFLTRSNMSAAAAGRHSNNGGGGSGSGGLSTVVVGKDVEADSGPVASAGPAAPAAPAATEGDATASVMAAAAAGAGNQA